MLRNARDEQIGALVVLNDITKMRQLESVRRDFVANVSHELRTPITAIQGFVETLREGAIRDAGRADRFLDIIGRKADRLNQIIEDLLELSRIETQEQKGGVELVPTRLKEVLQVVVMGCQPGASEKRISVVLDCPDELEGRVGPQLLEEAVSNLLDNAIKYSHAGSRVEVHATRRRDEVVVSVRDHGIGVPPEHLPHIFERFYCVDKGRSRKLGGTGLGLAIVKHIAQVHGGSVTVESEPGKGSVFTLHVPAS